MSGDSSDDSSSKKGKKSFMHEYKRLIVFIIALVTLVGGIVLIKFAHLDTKTIKEISGNALINIASILFAAFLILY